MSANIEPPKNNEEWDTLVAKLMGRLPTTFKTYHAPRAGDFNRAIDHTLLSWTATTEEIDRVCYEAHHHRFAAVCVRLKHVARAVQNLQQWPYIVVACVIAYPEGTQGTSEKEEEARQAIEQGAGELDMVLNWPLLKQKKYVSAYSDILEVRKIALEPVKLKVILETPQLTREEIVGASIVAIMAGADYIQSSTGIKEPRVTPELVSLMRATCDILGRGTKVKASGDFRTAEDCMEVLRAGADRVESSTSMQILQELGGEELQEQGVGHAMY